jgi:hypothetical protein
MISPHLIPRIGERIEQLDTAIFFGSSDSWRYPACVIRHIKVDRKGDHLWFRMKNISIDDKPALKAPAFLFCYNKHLNFYMTVEGNAGISGLAGNLGTPDGWQDPLYAHQVTYLVRMEIGHAATFNRPGLPVIPDLAEALFPYKPRRETLTLDSPYFPWPGESSPESGLISRSRQSKFSLTSFLAGLF